VDEGVERALAEARALGFLGDGPLEAHERSAAAFAEAIGNLPPGARALDLGSGGGVPGLLLASWYPDVRWTLLDKHRRRTSFLARAVASLGWADRVEVVREAAEVAAHDSAHRATYDLVVSRSFGPPALTAECAVGFLRVGGRFLVAEPPTPDPARWPASCLSDLGLVRRGEGPIAAFELTAPASAEVPRPWRSMERLPRWP
jgi:16S rRNA (guanine527-N7)-methyltransferase